MWADPPQRVARPWETEAGLGFRAKEGGREGERRQSDAGFRFFLNLLAEVSESERRPSCHRPLTQGEAGGPAADAAALPRRPL